MDDVRDEFAALFARCRGIAFSELAEEDKRPFRAYGECALRVVRENREMLFYAFGVTPSENAIHDVLQVIRRQHIAIGRAVERIEPRRQVSIPCPDCGQPIVIDRTNSKLGDAIRGTCVCGKVVERP